MGLLLLVVLGALLGWVLTLAVQAEAREDIVCNSGAGVIGAVLAGSLANATPLTQGLSGGAFLLGILGAATFIALANAMRNRA